MKAAYPLSPPTFGAALFRAPPRLALIAALATATALVGFEALKLWNDAPASDPSATIAVKPDASLNPFGAIAHLSRDSFGAPARQAAPRAAPVPATQPEAEKPRARVSFGGFLDLLPKNQPAPTAQGDTRAQSATAAPATTEPAAPPRRTQAAVDRTQTSLRRGRHVTEMAATPAAPAPDNRGFFERMFNVQPTQGAALAYARPEDGAVGNALRGANEMPMGYQDGRTAVYDISAKTVYMPNGEKLEAHSGLGNLLDDPGSVHVKNRGATPPNVYNLTFRESLFHGVQALRLTPVGGSSMYGRDGILAHTYMLGPKGDSNGCVSFKDYDRFLQAYKNGEVKRLIVVTRRT